MKNILFVSPTNTMDNGAEKSIYYLMEELVKKGHRVHNVTLKPGLEQMYWHSEVYEKIGVTNHYIESLKWWWEDAPGGYPGTEPERAYYYRRSVKETSDLIKAKQIDLVITNTVNVFAGAVAAALNGIPHYWLIHEFPENEFSYYKSKIDFIDSYSQELFSVSGELNESLAALFPNRTVKQFVPFTEIKKHALASGEKIRLISVGRLTERKNQLELIKAYGRLKAHYPDLELVLIGDGDKDYLKKCKEYVDLSQIEGINFLGYQDQPWGEITDKDISVFTSNQETFGLVYVEALLSGVPTIISDNLGHRTSYELFQSGEMYQLGDIDQLVEKISHMIDHFDEISYQALENVSKSEAIYTVEKVYEEIFTAIEQEKTLETKNPIRHLEQLLTVNREQGRLERYASRLSYLIRRLIDKIKS